MSKSEHIFFWKLHVFKIIIFFLCQFNSIFRKELLKASPNVLSKSFIGIVFCNSILRKIIYLGLEKYWTALLRSLGSYNYDLMDLNSKNIWIPLLESDWSYDILELYLKSTQTTLLDLVWKVLRLPYWIYSDFRI